jgi:trehalose 6-phosphate phosphatase
VQSEYFFENKGWKPECVHSGIFLFLDFDGTLAPMQNNPAQCILPPGIKSQLEEIASSGKACIVILSGRTVNDIKRRVQIRGIYYGGNHGLEISGPNLRYVHPDALQGRPIINKICRKIEKEVGDMEGALIEKKKFGFTLHYRMADKESKTSIKKIFYRIIAEGPGSQAFSVLRGKKVLELVPRIQWDKGKAALFLLEKQKRDYLPIYVGDDLTDETAFQTLREVGLTIRIGKSKKSAAQYYLKGQREVLRFLKHIHDLMR